MSADLLRVYTLIHVAISLIGIVSGIVATIGFLQSKRLDGWNSVFLSTTLATSVTGFGFPFERLLPSHIVGLLSTAILVVAFFARYAGRLEGRSRGAYVVTSMAALYLNVFVLGVQTFAKVPVFRQAAPTQTERPFALAQLTVFAVFAVTTVAAFRKFRPAARVESVSAGA